jgi:NAD(P)-dependent dehydrogenase (short-subunit alcohol dehydrogenase family)
VTTNEWTHKTYLVAGASSSIGQEVCASLLQNGSQVIAITRTEASLAKLSAMWGARLKIVSVDLSPVGSSQLVTKEIVGRLSGFVYCPGVLTIAPVKFYKHIDFTNAMRINCEAFLEICQGLMRKSLFEKGSSIVAVSSIMESHAVPGNAIYAASKAALSAAVNVLALELAREHIRVNTVSPGALASGMTREVEQSLSAEAVTKHGALYPLGVGAASDVSNLIIFLLSQSSRWITGTRSLIDGGYSCR